MRLVPLIPGTYTSDNQWGLAEIRASATSGGTNLIPRSTATATGGISTNTGSPGGLLETHVDDWAPWQTLESYWQVDAGTAILPNYVKHTARASPWGNQAPLVFAWCGSYDGVTWFSRGIVDDLAAGAYANGATREYALSPTIAPNDRTQARLWAINATEGNGPVDAVTVWGEVIFATSSGGPQVATGGYPIGEPQASYYGGLPKAFDNNNSSRAQCRAPAAWGKQIGYYWQTPQPNIAQVRIRAPSADANYMVKAGTIVWSSDGLNWNVAGSFSGQTGWSNNEERAFAVSP
jgi:hypothetical protein